MAKNAGWKISMSLEIETCEDFIEFIGGFSFDLCRCKFKSPNRITNRHGRVITGIINTYKFKIKCCLNEQCLLTVAGDYIEVAEGHKLRHKTSTTS